MAVVKWIIGCLVAGFLVTAFNITARHMSNSMYVANAGHPHRWFAWHPVRLQGGKPIPTVQEGGRIVWLKNIERFRFFDHWVYREIGDDRKLTR